jgi:hypothetical protein
MVAQAFTVDLDKPLVFQVNVTISNFVLFVGFESIFGVLVLCLLHKQL